MTMQGLKSLTVSSKNPLADEMELLDKIRRFLDSEWTETEALIRRK